MKRHIVLAIASFTVGAVMISSLIVAGVAQAAVGYTLNRSGKTITVDWDDVVGATSYSVTPVVNGTAMTPVIMTTSDYSDTSTIPNTSYVYQVVAMTTDGSVDLFTTSATRYSLTTPALTAKAVSYSTIDLKFSAVHGVQKYEVYRSTAKTKGFVQVASTDKLSFVDKSRTTGTSYYYKVRGVQVVDGKTYRTGWSTVKTARTSLDKTKATVTSPSYHTAKVTFSKVSGATKLQGLSLYKQ